MASKKTYNRRKVAESDAKSCWICYRPSSTVLVTPDNDDWFHVCPGHLKDRKFAIPQDAEDLEEKKRQEELEKEIEAVKKEYAEKMRKKLEKRKAKADKEEKNSEKKEDKDDKKEEEDKVKELEKKKEEVPASVHEPRIFELHKDFQLMRLQKRREVDQRKRNAEISKKNLETLRGAGALPSVPTGNP